MKNVREREEFFMLKSGYLGDVPINTQGDKLKSQAFLCHPDSNTHTQTLTHTFMLFVFSSITEACALSSVNKEPRILAHGELVSYSLVFKTPHAEKDQRH